MAATALQLPLPRLQPTTVPPGPRRPARPPLRLLEGGRAPSRLAQQAVYRRRRLLAVALVARAGARGRSSSWPPLPWPGSPAVPPPPPAAPRPPRPPLRARPGWLPATVVVQPGDTLWSIAADVAPDADVRITVDQLVALNGASPIVAGPGARSSLIERRGLPVACVSALPGLRFLRRQGHRLAAGRRRLVDPAPARCIDCGRRFTTFERVEETPLVVVKRSGDREPFDREKVATGIRLAAKGRPIEADGGEALDELINAVEDAIRLEGGEVSSEAVGRSVLERLREADPVAAVRFASVYLGFDDLSDFEREIKALSKRTEPKRH